MRLLVALTLLAGCAVQAGDSGEGETLTFVGGKADASGVYRAALRHGQGYLLVEVLDDDIIHFEYGRGATPSFESPIYASPMVMEQSWPGPERLTQEGNVIETAATRLEINEHGCIAVTDTTRDRYLTTVCPASLAADWKGISIDPAVMENVYGLGQFFRRLGSAEGDWTSHGRFRTDGEFGNHFAGFWGGADPQLQFPIMYAAGSEGDAFGLFLDNVYKQDWDFESDAWWQVRMFGDQVRFFVMTGPDLRDLRSDYLEITGTPPVPPRKAFGLWVSEFGFDNWGEIDWKLRGLRNAGFPVDGFVLDLQWFGNTWPDSSDTPMGGLRWDRNNFPDPERRIAQYARDGIGLIAIEESYVGRNQWTFREMRSREGLVHVCDSDYTTEFRNWMGHVGQIDWSQRDAAAWWHDSLRFPNIVRPGILGHWTDLGEPERYYEGSCYRGVEPWKYHHGDVHNLYNLLWHESIWRGYVRHHAEVNRRPFLLSRAGAPGLQRYGAAMWSGDIASRLDVLATHMNAAMHMSFAGIDYYGSDAGGFWRRALGDDTNVTNPRSKSEYEMYSQWFANSAWFDIPLRPHTYNCGFHWMRENGCPYEVSPAWVGNANSNRENLRQRYELIPYYYSLAHMAYRSGEAVIAPVVLHFQDDPNVRQMGHQKMIGPSLMVAVVASHGEGWRSVYLPPGEWVNYHTNEWHDSAGQWTDRLPVWRDDVLRLPTFARAGAILPMMWVDEQTRDAYGARLDGSVRNELVVRVFADERETAFTLTEDDGATVDRYDGGRPRYLTRTTELRQQLGDGAVTVTIGGASGSYPNAPSERNNELRIVTRGRRAASVTVNGESLPRLDGAAEVRTAGRGFADLGGNTLMVRTGSMDVGREKVVVVTLQ